MEGAALRPRLLFFAIALAIAASWSGCVDRCEVRVGPGGASEGPVHEVPPDVAEVRGVREALDRAASGEEVTMRLGCAEHDEIVRALDDAGLPHPANGILVRWSGEQLRLQTGFVAGGAM